MKANTKIENMNGTGRNREKNKQTGKQYLDHALSIYSCVIQRSY